MSEVWTPAAVSELCALMKQASAQRHPLHPVGAGSRAPALNRTRVSTARLTRIVEYEPADLVLSAEGGATMHDLRLSAAAHGQQLALDAAAHRDATLGGTVALNASGPLRLHYGTPRDQVVGLELVTGDGRLLRLGGKVVKNVAGYDLTRLVIGSRGALGVIAKVHVRLYPLPAEDRTFVLTAPTAALLDLVPLLTRSHFEPAALELQVGAGESQLALRVHGNADVINAARHTLAELPVPAIELSVESALEWWSAVADRELTATVRLRLAAAPSDLGVTLRLALEFDALQARVIVAHAANGIVRLAGAAAEPATLAVQVMRARAQLERMKGSLLVERAPFELPQSRPAGAVVRLLDQLKRVFDPADILPAHWRHAH